MTNRVLLRILERERQAFATERAQLLDVICRLAGQPQAPSEMDMWQSRMNEEQAARRADEERLAREAEEDLVDYEQLPV